MRGRLKASFIAVAVTLAMLVPTSLVPVAKAQTCVNHSFTVGYQAQIMGSGGNWTTLFSGKYRVTGTMCYSAGQVTEARMPQITKLSGNTFPNGASPWFAYTSSWGRQGVSGFFTSASGCSIMWDPYQQMNGTGGFSFNDGDITGCGNLRVLGTITATS